jgi:hypothetical protein
MPDIGKYLKYQYLHHGIYLVDMPRHRVRESRSQSLLNKNRMVRQARTVSQLLFTDAGCFCGHTANVPVLRRIPL